MEKNTQDGLSDAQAEEVADTIDALTFELRAELKVLGTELDTLGKDVDELAAKVDKMDVPEDNIEFTMDVTTQAEVAEYGETEAEEAAAIALLEDGDAVDADYVDDTSDFVSNKAFFQEWDFGVNGNLGDAEFNLAVDTIANVFTEENTVFDAASETDTADTDGLEFDSALLEVAYNNYNFKMGDMDGYVATDYFLNDPDLEGIEMTTSYMDTNIKAFAFGEDYDSDVSYTGVTAGRDMDFATITGKLYHARNYEVVSGTDSDVTTVGVQAEDIAVTDAVTMGAEVAFSDDSEADSDVFARLNGEFAAYEDLTVNALVEMAGEDFTSVNGDLEEDNDYTKFNVGAEYVLNENNTVTGDYTAVDYDPGAEVKSTVEVGLDNMYGDFTNNASVAYTMNDSYTDGHDTMVLTLGTEYAWNDSLTLGAELVNKNEEDNSGDLISYNYLTAFADKEIADNITWNNDVFYMDGTVGTSETVVPGTPGITANDDSDGEAMGMTTSLSVSF